MKLAIVGGRDFDDYERLKAVVDRVKTPITLIVSGSAAGADSLGEKYAREHSIPTLIHKADWAKHGKRAGFLRNIDIINDADCVIAFWDKISKGTASSIELARKHNKPTHIVYYGEY